MKALILAGGLGTRLRSMVSDVPKPMADINGKPFLSYLLKSLSGYSFDEYIISIGYMADKVIDVLGDNYCGVPIKYVVEEQPLGTGGAIKYSLENNVDKDEYVFVLNGDTFLNVNFDDVVKYSKKQNSEITMVIKRLESCARYGTVEYKDSVITGFKSSGMTDSGWINGGIYLMKPSILEKNVCGEKFSFEKDILEKIYLEDTVYVYESSGYFIDIGVPEDLVKARKELHEYL